jgi:hypothetical protein
MRIFYFAPAFFGWAKCIMAHPKQFLGGPWPTQNTVWRPHDKTAATVPADDLLNLADEAAHKITGAASGDSRKLRPKQAKGQEGQTG